MRLVMTLLLLLLPMVPTFLAIRDVAYRPFPDPKKKDDLDAGNCIFTCHWRNTLFYTKEIKIKCRQNFLTAEFHSL